jgi:hypothetical protein
MFMKLQREARERVKDPKRRPAKVKNANAIEPAEFGTSYGFTAESPEEIPFFLRATADKYPYGNVHIALRIDHL